MAASSGKDLWRVVHDVAAVLVLIALPFLFALVSGVASTASAAGVPAYAGTAERIGSDGSKQSSAPIVLDENVDLLVAQAPGRIAIEAVYCEVDGKTVRILSPETWARAKIHVVMLSAEPESADLRIELADVTEGSTSQVPKAANDLSVKLPRGVLDDSLMLAEVFSKSWVDNASTIGGLEFRGRQLELTARLTVKKTEGGSLGIYGAGGFCRLRIDAYTPPDWSLDYRECQLHIDDQTPEAFWKFPPAALRQRAKELHDLGFNTLMVGNFYEPDPTGISIRENMWSLMFALAQFGAAGGFNFPAKSYSHPPESISAETIRNAVNFIQHPADSVTMRVIAYTDPAALSPKAVAARAPYADEDQLKENSQAVPLRLLETMSWRTLWDCVFLDWCSQSRPFRHLTKWDALCDFYSVEKVALQVLGPDLRLPRDCCKGFLPLLRLASGVVGGGEIACSGQTEGPKGVRWLEYALDKAEAGHPMYWSEPAGTMPNYEEAYRTKVAADLKAATEAYGFDALLLDDVGRARESTSEKDRLFFLQILRNFERVTITALPEAAAAVQKWIADTVRGLPVIGGGLADAIESLEVKPMVHACFDGFMLPGNPSVTLDWFDDFALTREDLASSLYPRSMDWSKLSATCRDIRVALKEKSPDKITVSSDYYTHEGWSAQPLSEDIYSSDKFAILSRPWAQQQRDVSQVTLRSTRTDLAASKLAPTMLELCDIDAPFARRFGPRRVAVNVLAAWAQGADVGFREKELDENPDMKSLVGTLLHWRKEHLDLLRDAGEAGVSPREMIYHSGLDVTNPETFEVTSADGAELRTGYGLNKLAVIGYRRMRVIDGTPNREYIAFVINAGAGPRKIRFRWDGRGLSTDQVEAFLLPSGGTGLCRELDGADVSGQDYEVDAALVLRWVVPLRPSDKPEKVQEPEVHWQRPLGILEDQVFAVVTTDYVSSTYRLRGYRTEGVFALHHAAGGAMRSSFHRADIPDLEYREHESYVAFGGNVAPEVRMLVGAGYRSMETNLWSFVDAGDTWPLQPTEHHAGLEAVILGVMAVDVDTRFDQDSRLWGVLKCGIGSLSGGVTNINTRLLAGLTLWNGVSIGQNFDFEVAVCPKPNAPDAPVREFTRAGWGFGVSAFW
jgi:hypothetical protein